MDLPIKRLTDTALIPSRSTPGSAGLDLYAAKDVRLLPGTHQVIRTGIAAAIPGDHVGLIWPRSGLAVRGTLDVLAGVIDCDFRGEIQVVLVNHGVDAARLFAGDRIAQLLIQPVAYACAIEVEQLGQTMRGDRGWGSTGT